MHSYSIKFYNLDYVRKCHSDQSYLGTVYSHGVIYSKHQLLLNMNTEHSAVKYKHLNLYAITCQIQYRHGLWEGSFKLYNSLIIFIKVLNEC